MNSFKPLITIAILGGIGYVVYTRLNSQPSSPPPGAPSGWENAPTVQMPGEGAANDKWGGSGGAANSLLPQTPLPGTASANVANTAATTAPTFSGTPAEANSPNVGGIANYNDPPGNTGTQPTNDKWGTTDPSAAVANNTPPPTANYGDAPVAETQVPNNDRYPSNPPDAAPTDSYGAAPPAAGDQQDVGQQFQAAWEKSNKLLEDGKLVDGLTELSYWHEHPRLSASENDQLNSLLDQAAGSVIYSTQHYLEPAHVVKEGERLEDIAAQYNVPWQLIARINGIDDPASLQPGEQLKVIRGPFGAVIQLEKKQLTLMLNNMYAGRFLIGVGLDMPPREGTFVVSEKVANPVYHGRERTIAADDPSNPLGEYWIALGSDMGIHSVGPLTDIGSTNQPGSISMGQSDIDDVFDILSVGSKVMIVK